MSFTIGLLGGLGPISTGFFYADLVKKLQSTGIIKKNTDFPHIIINSIPAPELTHQNPSHEDIRPYIIGIQELNIFHPDISLMICNSIHAYFDEVKKESHSSSLVSVKEIIYKVLKKQNAENVCVVGMPATIQSKLYEYKDFSYIPLVSSEQETLSLIVSSYNADGNTKKWKPLLENLLREKQKNDNVHIFVLACTEISALAKDIQGIKIIDTMDGMINFLIDQFTGFSMNNVTKS